MIGMKKNNANANPSDATHSDMALMPDVYMPSINQAGEYVDVVSVKQNGLRCPCTASKDKVYATAASFQCHIKTKQHQKFITDMNSNKENYYVKAAELEEVVKQQRMLIAKMEKEIQTNRNTIRILTDRITECDERTYSNSGSGNLQGLDDIDDTIDWSS